MIGRESSLIAMIGRQGGSRWMAGRSAWEGSSEAVSWSSFLENCPPGLCENRITVETANPRGPLQPKKLSVWRVSLIFIYDHNTNYKFKTYLGTFPEEEG